MNKLLNSTLRAGLVTLCSACAIWATTGLSAQARSPGVGGSVPHGRGNGFDGRNCFGTGFGFGGWGGGLLGYELDGNEDRIPYYALHPPVYYSYPIARPYGDSPFASPPGYYGPGLEEGGPHMIVNPYATPGKAAPSNAAPSNPTPTPPAPAKKSPDNVKTSAARTASLFEDAAPSVESLPSPAPISLPVTDPSPTINVHLVLNPYVKGA